ncbi:hypothetical protein BDQ94DRAFT_140459 [Aspergillus welwitschiae]|uniref:Uncharacterized protein n=1 Tax=Aspergillus welwitschiae TaxID=1341132 RepID=A0A3F3Q859_9EURO|nr:hypothetical protein BDQ94DRAFT_140459 [Aspergillus welwitschiae]RDH35237.1 hypothetical protein BDQ94DRAFT_140459 [Aspergillus welwitschiae]
MLSSSANNCLAWHGMGMAVLYYLLVMGSSDCRTSMHSTATQFLSNRRITCRVVMRVSEVVSI